jgi:hypothetical protein
VTDWLEQLRDAINGPEPEPDPVEALASIAKTFGPKVDVTKRRDARDVTKRPTPGKSPRRSSKGLQDAQRSPRTVRESPWPTLVHESAHAIAARDMGYRLGLVRVQQRRDGRHSGQVALGGDQLLTDALDESPEARARGALVKLAGPVAESIYTGRPLAEALSRDPDAQRLVDELGPTAGAAIDACRESVTKSWANVLGFAERLEASWDARSSAYVITP